MGKLHWPLCAYYSVPDARRLALLGPDAVIGCKEEQGSGPLWFFVPVHGGAVRAGVCLPHARLLEKHHGPGSYTVTTEREVRDGKPWQRRVIVVDDWADVSRQKRNRPA